jgi:hypothetical protein
MEPDGRSRRDRMAEAPDGAANGRSKGMQRKGPDGRSISRRTGT